MMMKSTLVLFALAAVASAQNNSTESDSAAPAVPTYTPSAEEQCTISKKCGTDMNCIAGCYNVPNPTEQQTNVTSECFLKCPETGSDVESCRSKCVNENYMPSSSDSSSSSDKSDKKDGDKKKGNGSASDDSSATGDDSDESGAAHVVASLALALPALAAVSQLL
ncbi:hypothetical protein H4R34_000301 [Dimargaris verticillata]|uniref:Uncharacterized protein n=1 Tax=Dimargaris verticillata TaxID=2761393 RepID=A0A9W8EBZ0_9FUNG|nr:hypothetical protein H4R34_000301 [Dimargaris verticillata]